MRTSLTIVVLVLSFVAGADTASAQDTAGVTDASRKWEILDNSFLVEEAFNQEAGVFQNIFTWIHEREGAWGAAFTQEWPAPRMAHQLSYTVAFASSGDVQAFGDLLINYRYQLREETAGGPAISPRVSLIVPTGRESAGLGSGTAGAQVNLPISKQFGNLYVHANVGHTWLPDVENTTQVAGSGIWRLRPMLNLMLEGVLQFGELATFSPGLRGGWNIGDRQLILGAAVPFTRTDRRTTAGVLTYVSYELPFRR